MGQREALTVSNPRAGVSVTTGLPTVYHPAYEYSIPGVQEDFLPQTEPLPPEAPPLDPVMA